MTSEVSDIAEMLDFLYNGTARSLTFAARIFYFSIFSLWLPSIFYFLFSTLRGDVNGTTGT